MNDFETLLSFLERSDVEVCGRGEVAIEPGVMEKLERLIKGACSQEEIREVCELIKDNPARIKWVADRIKEARRNEQP